MPQSSYGVPRPSRVNPQRGQVPQFVKPEYVVPVAPSIVGPVGRGRSYYNVARTLLGATASASSTFSFSAQSLLDDGGGRHDSSGKQDQTITVDLGRSQWIDSVGMTQEANPYSATYMFVETSLNGSTYYGAYNGASGSGLYVAFRPTYARYVRLTSITGAGENWVKYSIQVYVCKPLKLPNPLLPASMPIFGTLSQTNGGPNNGVNRQSVASVGRWDFSGSSAGHNVQLDLGVERTVTTINFEQASSPFAPATLGLERYDASRAVWVRTTTIASVGGLTVFRVPRFLNKARYWRVISVVGGGNNWVYYQMSAFCDTT